ncbi:hypothetical protein OsJ_14238 [Oryza sativa Japonica Group]|uniref:Uncharacterized protein n=1 Tax=Oryza sativa subsp. japonica TaxID=39947 RepID=A3AS92_ORYSJ|nr:hypothetical protein OsJ_14238 [Oryza sativa Japonica Group]
MADQAIVAPAVADPAIATGRLFLIGDDSDVRQGSGFSRLLLVASLSSAAVPLLAGLLLFIGCGGTGWG